MTTKTFALFLPLFLICIAACAGQNPSIDRKPAVAGQFYPAGAGELRAMLATMFAHAIAPQGRSDITAIIVPHAGYVFSGEVSASAFAQIDSMRDYENIFILGPSHHVGFDGASVYTAGDFLTPLGKVEVNRELGALLIKGDAVLSNRTDAHEQEHSVEVQVPFLQYHMKSRVRIVPIVINAASPATCKRIASVLKPYMNGKNLFVISSDFSHYPSYDDAEKVDKLTADAILSNSPSSLLATLAANEQARIPHLATSLCGWPAVLTLLYMTEDMNVRYATITYRNSGDAGLTDKKQVVGYWAITVSQTHAEHGTMFELNQQDRTTLLSIARTTIAEHLGNDRTPRVDETTLSATLKTPCGAFVTLNKSGHLRGCIGRFDATESLYKVVQEMAVAAATQDYRFQPVKPTELPDIQIEISVLTPLRRISSIDEFQLGKQGIYIKKGGRAGTFLPQVADETGWTKEEFLGHCAQDKAGLTWDGWKDAELYVYDAIVFGEH